METKCVRPFIKLMFFGLILFSQFKVFSQTSVGVNTTSPNKNAVLELISPGNNQGFLVPRLSTIQRTTPSFMGSLSASENGLLVYDSDENIFYYWNNPTWQKVSSGDIPTLGQVLASKNDALNYKIINLQDPTNEQDAVTKKYVDLANKGLLTQIIIIGDSVKIVDSKVTSLTKIVQTTRDSVKLVNNKLQIIRDSVHNINTILTTVRDSVYKVNTILKAHIDSVLTKGAGLPNQVGHNGEYLSTDGTAASWSAVTTDWSKVTNKPANLDVDKTDDITTSTNAGGDLTGTYPNPTIGVGKVDNNKLAADAVTSSKILDGTIVNADIADGTIDVTKKITGVLPITNGGTGASTQQTAINSLAGSTTTGQFLRGNGTNVVMSPIQATDVPTLNQNTTGNAATATTATTATNLTGGSGGQIPYQSAVNATSFIPNGTAGQVLTSAGGTNPPQWTTVGAGTVLSVTISPAIGFTGSVTTPNSNPDIKIGTSVSGILLGNGTGVTAAVAGTDYLAPKTIVGATKTKITYDNNGIVTSGTDATTADINPSTNRNYVTDVQQTVIQNTSGTNTGDESSASIKTKLGVADASNDGYLSKTDWSTFNNKLSSVKAGSTKVSIGGTASDPTVDVNPVNLGTIGLNTGTTGNDVNITGSPANLGGAFTFNIPTASATNRGALSTSDWTNFNSAYTNRISSLTTTGTSGAATLNANILNIPNYTLAGLGGIGLTGLSASLPLKYDNTTGAFSANQANGTTDGYLAKADWNTFNNKENTIATGAVTDYLRGDKTWQTLNTSIVPEGSNLYFTNIRALSATLGATYTKGPGGETILTTDNLLQAIQKLEGNISAAAGVTKFNTRTGDITLTSADVTTALGFTPYSNTNPSGFISANQSISFAPIAGGDITGSATGTTSLTPTLLIGNNKVTNAHLAQMPTMTFKGNNTGGLANTIDLTISDVKTMLGITNGDVTLAGENYLTLSGQQITANKIDINSQVLGTLAIANGGTNSTTALTNDRVMVSSSGAIVEAPVGNAGQVLTSGGAGVAPSWTTPTTGTVTSVTAGSNKVSVTGTAKDPIIDVVPANLGTIGLNTGTTGSDVNVSGSPANLNGTVTLNIPDASDTSRGALTSADWTTFNNKQSALTFSTGLTNSTGTVTVNTSQNITNLTNLNTAGLVKTTGTGGALSVATSGTDYAPATTGTSLLKANGSGGFAAATGTDIPNIAESQVTNLVTDLSNKVSTTTTINGHALSSNVTISASDITTGTLPHAQLPALVSGDIPNNAANTTGSAASLSAQYIDWNATTGGSSIANKPTLTNGTVTSIATGTGLTGGPITTTGTVSLANTAVTAGTYGSSTEVPVFDVDAQGRITGVTNTIITGAAPTGAAGGDLTGNFPNPTIKADAVTSAKILDKTIANADIADATIDLTTKVTGALPIANGGTGSTTQQTAINALTGTQSNGKYLRSDGTDAILSALDAGDITTGTLAITNGGTGATTASNALSNLGGQPLLVSGTNIKTVNATSLLGSGDISVGTVTSIAALTLGTAGTDLGSTVSNGTSTPVITLNVPTASATNRGALASSDWTNFNTAYTNRITTINAPLSLSSNALSLDYNTTNLKLTTSKLNTIQDIATTSSPSFTGLTLSGLSVKGIVTNLASGDLGTQNGTGYLKDDGTGIVTYDNTVLNTGSSFYLGSTSIPFNRASGSLSLSGITSIDGSAAKWTNARSIAGNSVDGSANVAFTNKFIVQGTADAGLSGAQFLGALGNGLVKNTTTTGVLSIATSGTDYAPATSGTSLLKADGSGGFAAATGTDIPNIAESQVTNLVTDLSNKVPTSTTVNGHALSSNVTVSASDLTTGTLAIANGGTGQSTQQTAIDALTGGVTTGQYLRGNGTHVVMSAIQSGDITSALGFTPYDAANPLGYISANQSISFTPAAGGDVTGSSTNATSLTPTLTIGANKVTNAKLAQMPTLTLKGNNTGGASDPLDLTVANVKTMLGIGAAGATGGDITLSGQNYLSLTNQALTANAVDLSGTNATGTLAAARFPALTGDVTNIAGSLTSTVAKINGATLGTTTATNKNILVADGSQWNSVALSGDATISNAGALTIGNKAITLAKMNDMATGSLIYRKTAGTGVPEVQTLATLKTDLGLSNSNSGDITIAGQNYLSLTGQALTANAVDLSGTNATGTLAAARFPALTGDVTNTAGSLTSTVAKINGATLGTTTATNKNILVADGSQWNSVALSGDATISNVGALALANTTVTAAAYGSATQVATFTVDAKGRLTAAGNTTISGVAPGGSAGGDLSGTYPNPSVATVGAVTAANVASGANLANAATNANTASSIVKRDASGNFTAGTITAALIGNASTATKLAATKNINGVAFDGSADITVPVNSANDVATVSSVYPLWTTAAGNTAAKISTTALSFVPSTGVLSATGFNGSGAALTNIPNSALTNSSVTIGSTAISLGGTATTIAGLTSVTSTGFTGALTGNASTATSLAGGTAMSIHYQSSANNTAFLAAGTAGSLLTTNSTGSAPTWTAPSSLSVGSATTATTATHLAGGGAGTIPYQSAAGTTAMATAGTANQVLHGGAAPSFSAVDLSSADVTNTLPINKGGTGQTTASTAFNALSPITTLGDIIYGSAANTSTRLAGNTTASKLFLTQTGNGTVSAAPAWGSIASTDVTGLGGTPAITLGTAASAGTATTYIKTDATIIAFDATSPVALGTAAAGSATVAARRDHVHPAADLSTTAITGTLPVSHGGTGLTTFGGSNTVLYTSTADNIASVAASGGAGYFLQTNTIGSAPTWKQTLGVANGGTGATSLTAHGVVIGNGTSAVNVTAVGSTGQILQGNTGADPSYSTATYPSTTTINQILYSSAANTVTGLATANNGVLVTSGTGVPSISNTVGAALTMPSLNLSATSNQLVLQSGGVTGTITWTPATSNKTITLPNATGTVALTSDLPTYSAGDGIAISSNTLSFKNSSSLTDKVLPRWDGTGKQLVNSSIFDDGSGHVKIGNSTISTSYNCEITGTFKTDKIYHSSDARFKKNIFTLDSALLKVLKMRGVSYEWNKEKFPERNFSSGVQIGLIAQEVEKQFPQLVNTDASGYKAVEYANLVAVLIEAVKEQQKMIDKQTAEITSLKADNQKAQTEIGKMEDVQKQMDALKKQMAGLQDMLQLITPTVQLKK